MSDGASSSASRSPASVALVSDAKMLLHQPGPGHPERPDRLRAITSLLDARPVSGARWIEPRVATREEVSRVHDEDHVARIDGARGESTQLDADTAVSAGSVDAAYLAAGAGLAAVEHVFAGETRRAFALVRPPGHHAEAHAAMGFCLFNNVAVAAAHARTLGARRVMIVDWDVHHGNGTQHAFYDRDDVLFVSLHQHPFYPGTGLSTLSGSDAGEGYNINVPFSPGKEDGDYGAAFERLVGPVANRFEPDLVLVSAGFDAHRDDPLGDMRLTEDAFASMAGAVVAMADRHAGGRLAMLLEGGYDLGALSRSVRSVIEVLAGATPPSIGAATPLGERELGEVLDRHRAQWRL